MSVKKHILLFVLVIFSFYFTQGQGEITVIQKIIDTKLVHINSIDPNDTVFLDLKPIKEAIGDAKIIMLGEQDHGDAATFLAKTRLIKYLHEECGFGVLAFESDFYSLNMSWEKVQKNEIDVKYACNNRNVYPLWTKCEQNQELFNYLSNCLKTTDPLIITGFDCRHAGGYAKENYVRQFDSVMKAFNLPIIQAATYSDFILILKEVIGKEYGSKVSLIKQQEFLRILDTVAVQLKLANAKADDFWNQELKNLKGYALNSWLPEDLSNDYSSNIRDSQMSNNLLWLSQKKYADKKIIVWAHNFHISKNIDLTEAKKSKEIVTMGAEVHKELKDGVYVLGFDSYQGTAGQIGTKTHKVDKPSVNSFEYYVFQKKPYFAFINFKGINDADIESKSNFKMKALLHREIKGEWIRVFDGVFYIKDMYPCKECDFH